MPGQKDTEHGQQDDQGEQIGAGFIFAQVGKLLDFLHGDGENIGDHFEFPSSSISVRNKSSRLA